VVKKTVNKYDTKVYSPLSVWRVVGEGGVLPENKTNKCFGEGRISNLYHAKAQWERKGGKHAVFPAEWSRAEKDNRNQGRMAGRGENEEAI